MDQEPAILALKERLIEALGTKVEIIEEESPVGDHQANGEIENAIKEVEKQIRVLKLLVESKDAGRCQGRPPGHGVDSATRRFSFVTVSSVKRREDRLCHTCKVKNW